MKIVLLAGSTAGHLFPCIEVYRRYQNKINKVIILAEKKPIPLKLLKDIKDSLFIEPINSLKSYHSALKQLVQFDKDVVILSFGGRPSCLIPLLYFKGYKNLFIYELNRVIGRSNKLALPFAKCLFSYFPLKEKRKVKVIGHIQEEDRKYNNLRIEGKRILVLTGSNGSKDLFKLFDEIKLSNKGIDITISLGQNKYEFKSDIKTVEFIKTFLYQKYDLIIARSGAGTIMDVIRYNVPVLFLPSPNVKDNHQEKNAAYLKDLIGINYLMPKDYYKLNSVIEEELKYHRRKKLVSKYHLFQHQNVFINMNKVISDEKV